MNARPQFGEPDKNGNFKFDMVDFLDISAFALMHFGLCLPETKFELVRSRLLRRTRDLDIYNYADYRKLLESSIGSDERLKLLSALTTNVTHFFRESHHFDKLRDTVLPPLLKAAEAGKKLRIWSAACSTGQEPFSIALTILELCPNSPNLDIKILATDIDPVVVETAKLATYTAHELSPVPKNLVAKNITFNQVDSTVGQMNKNARDMITFGSINLVKDFPISGPMDIIFCRNVVIYFNKEAQQNVWNRFHKIMPTGGYLFIGHSERISGPATKIFENCGVTTYIKK